MKTWSWWQLNSVIAIGDSCNRYIYVLVFDFEIVDEDNKQDGWDTYKLLDGHHSQMVMTKTTWLESYRRNSRENTELKQDMQQIFLW